MAKYKTQNDIKPDPPGQSVTSGSNRSIGLAILVGVAALVVLTGMNLYETRKQRTELSDQMSQMLTALNNRPAAPQPQRPSGPDPDKVYTVKTEGAPFEGPPSAPITIAEFSDFQ